MAVHIFSFMTFNNMKFTSFQELQATHAKVLEPMNEEKARYLEPPALLRLDISLG